MVVWAVGKFRAYIEGVHTVVYADRQALRWFMSLKTPTGRLARWTLRLQAFDLEIRYTSGRCEAIADLLSRLTEQGDVSPLRLDVYSVSSGFWFFLYTIDCQYGVLSNKIPILSSIILQC